ncbi:MAG: IS1 family transposase [Trueperaceae bacterium]|nr:IS1 family transposase [Trueperaceae bacterium]
MVTRIIQCYHCGSEDIVKNGKARNGKKRYYCKTCKQASRENPDHGYSEARKEEILRAYRERPSMRGIARIFCISRNTLASWLKKPKRFLPLKKPWFNLRNLKPLGSNSMKSGLLLELKQTNAGKSLSEWSSFNALPMARLLSLTSLNIQANGKFNESPAASNQR